MVGKVPKSKLVALDLLLLAMVVAQSRPMLHQLPLAASAAAITSTSLASIFSIDQWKALFGIICNAKVSDDRLSGMFSSSSWIIDTGSFHHIMGE